MKNIIILIAISLGLTNGIFAQTSFALNFVDTNQVSGVNNTVTIPGTLTSNSLTPMQMSMELLNINIPNDWEMIICDAEQCRLPGITSSVFAMSPSNSAPVFVYFEVGNTAAIGTATVKIRNLGTSEASIWTLTANATATGIVNYSINERKPIRTEWFTLQGQLIDDIERVPNGVYIQRLSFEEGAPLSSQIYIDRN